MIPGLVKWKKDWAMMPSLFEPREIAKIKNKLKKMKIDNVVYCSFENRFAKSGGLAAVTTKFPPFLKEVNNISKLILVTPFYPNIINSKDLISTDKHFTVPFQDKLIEVSIFEYTWSYAVPRKGKIKEYYLKAHGFFHADNRLHDPYIYNENDPEKNAEAIKDNALFYCKAVPEALAQLDIRKNILCHLQDWQTALISLTSKEAVLNGKLESCATVQTLHNSFDSFISWPSLATIIEPERAQKIAAGNAGNGITSLQLGLQLVDAPINTVSKQFAEEFTSDIIQKEQFAPHLQKIFNKNRVLGINNGLFVDFPAEYLEGPISIERIKKIKGDKRKRLLKILAAYHPEERFGKLTYKGRSIAGLPDKIPILVMSGRLDPIQKGYDILLQVLERFKQDEIKAVLTPMAVVDSDLDLFYETAKKCKGNLTVFPMRMQKGFIELQMGATFGIMPSIYEPFGAAVEYMVNGTVNIARETGGLIDQIENGISGVTYREGKDIYLYDNISDFTKTSDALEIRRNNIWVKSMVNALYQAIDNSIQLYQEQENVYYELIINGFKKAKQFNWAVSAKEYYQLFNLVNI